MNLLNSKILSYSAYQVIDRIIGFFFIPLLLLWLTVDQYAIWTQIVVTVGNLLPIALFGIPTVLMAKLTKYSGNESSVIMLSLIPGLIIILLITSVILSFAEHVSIVIFGIEGYGSFTYVIVILLLSEYLFEMLTLYFRFLERIEIISFFSIMKSLYRVIFLSYFLKIKGVNFPAAMSTYALCQLALIAMLFLSYIRYDTRSKISNGFLKLEMPAVLKSAIPVVLATLCITTINSFDRFVLVAHWELETIGKFALASSVAGLGALIYSSIGFSLFPKLAKTWEHSPIEEKNELMNSIVERYSLLQIPLIIGMGAVGPELTYFLSNSKISIEMLLCFGLSLKVGLFGFYQLIYYGVLLALGPARSLSIFVVVALANIVLSVIFIKFFAIWGAVLAGCLTNILLVYLSIRILRPYCQIKIRKLNLGLYTAIGFLSVGSIRVLDLVWKSENILDLSLKIIMSVFLYFITYYFIRKYYHRDSFK